MKYANPWLRLSFDMMHLSAEAGGVVALRMMKVAQGGAAATAEAELMVSEKLRSTAEVAAQFWTSAMTGTAHLAPQRAVSHYRRKVRANRRRLSK